MRKTLAVATVFGLGLGLLAGCSKQPTSSFDARTAATENAQLQRIGVPRPALGYVAHFASMPDRGELLAYDHVLATKRGGAYTAYPVSISEEHALNAISKGDLVLNAPDGQPIRLKYESRVEHADGNWTWIGRNAEGASAVLTFGENAVYGTIPQGASDVLRVTMSGGHSYLVATDRTKLAGVGGMPHIKGSDFMTPPKRAITDSVGVHGQFAAASRPALATAAAAPTVVDVLVGYTDGYLSGVGSQSAVQTRIISLIDYTNVAYNNSGVAMRVRLVGFKQVAYPDNTDNGDTLQKMSGFDTNGPITSDARFNDLRAMRESTGADLVVLLRKFNTPENGGCGIAWLIGGNQSGITTADAPYGYSVVSDGQDRDNDGNNYYCIDATLAHELGHNMGQAHNKEDSKDDQGNLSYGLHPYSFGYRETTSNGFHTVMAYPATGDQVSIPYFANPAIKYANRPTGVANDTDNVRSMNLSMPIVGQFRATVVPVSQITRRDVDGNGRSDLYWRNGEGRLAYWLMSGATIAFSSPSVAQSNAYKLVATADFTGDRRGEVVWQSPSDVVMWRNTGTGNNAAYSPTTVTATPAGWSIIGSADVNGDGKGDLLWRNTASGNVAFWLMDGATVKSKSASKAIAPAFKLMAIGDFNGDGLGDLVWDNNTSVVMWLSTTTAFNQVNVSSHPAGWTIQGAGDITGDGKSDLYWRNTASGNFAYWTMNGATVTTKGASIAIPTSYKLIASGDLSGDGRADLVWDNNVSVWAWLAPATGTTFTQTKIGNHPAGWTPQAPPAQ